MPKEDAVVITRIFDAPLEKVWKAWTEPEQMKKWWGPQHFTAPTIEIDFREGGKYLYAMHGPAGTPFDKDMWSTGVYKEIVPMKKIVTTDNFADADGNVVPASYYGMPGDVPTEYQVTVTFEEVDGKTKMILKHVGMLEGADDMTAGWNQSFDKLAASLK